MVPDSLLNSVFQLWE